MGRAFGTNEEEDEQIYLREIIWSGMDWIGLAQDTDNEELL
jgi:hypothetical protein